MKNKLFEFQKKIWFNLCYSVDSKNIIDIVDKIIKFCLNYKVSVFLVSCFE
jgi:hypothetical protein